MASTSVMLVFLKLEVITIIANIKTTKIANKLLKKDVHFHVQNK